MLTRHTGWTGLLALTASALLGCSGDEGGPARTGSAAETAGSVGLALTLMPGVTIDAFNYVVSGPGGFARSGAVDISQSAKLAVLISSLPAGSGYSVSISATSTDSATSCSGSSAFAVSAKTTSQVTVNLQCREAPKKGSVTVTGALNTCPVLDGIDASPADALIGTPIRLAASAHDSDAGPAALGYQWAASSGNLSNGTTATPTVTCTVPGPVTVTATASDGDCSDSLTATVNCSAPVDDVTIVSATVETAPVPDSGDAADDPAVWVHPTTPALSVIIGTDKQAGGGLGVYDLSGAELQYLPAGKLNNVDLRDDFTLAGSAVPLVTAGNRTDNTIAIFALDPATRQLRDVAARKITTLVTYGSCMYKSPVSGKFYYFVDDKEGHIEQWELFESSGKVDATKVRDLHQLGSQPEACAVDDEAKALFVGEEAKGVWRFDAEPDVTSGPGYDGVLIASTDPGGHLVRDVEGVAIAKTSATAGYIFVSNQGVSTYSVFERQPPHAYVKTFRVERGSACVDAVTGSDGIEVSTANLGPAFPHGAFVTQDDSNDGLSQNFKLVPLEQILGGAPVVDDSACASGGSGGAGGSGTGGSSGGGAGAGGATSTGYGEPFCTTFCDKCATCYATGTFSEGDCVYQLPKTAFTIEDCKAGCAVSATPGAAAKAALSPGFEALSCSQFDDAM
jgi:3-phytase